VVDEVVEEPGDRGELELRRGEEAGADEDEPDDHLRRPRALDEEEHAVDGVVDDDDVDERGDRVVGGQAGEDPLDRIDHAPSLTRSKTASASRTRPTSWTRIALAPAAAAASAAPMVASSRSPTGLPVSVPRKRLR